MPSWSSGWHDSPPIWAAEGWGPGTFYMEPLIWRPKQLFANSRHCTACHAMPCQVLSARGLCYLCWKASTRMILATRSMRKIQTSNLKLRGVTKRKEKKLGFRTAIEEWILNISLVDISFGSEIYGSCLGCFGSIAIYVIILFQHFHRSIQRGRTCSIWIRFSSMYVRNMPPAKFLLTFNVSR
jgi:hypothetical protein